MAEEVTEGRREKESKKTHNSWYSLVVTHPTTNNQPISSLSMPERTGQPVLLSLWSYVLEMSCSIKYIITYRRLIEVHGKERFGLDNVSCVFSVSLQTHHITQSRHLYMFIKENFRLSISEFVIYGLWSRDGC